MRQLLGGKQDQYSASFGGFNYIEFNKSNEVIVNNLDIDSYVIQELEASLLLFLLKCLETRIRSFLINQKI